MSRIWWCLLIAPFFSLPHQPGNVGKPLLEGRQEVPGVLPATVSHSTKHWRSPAQRRRLPAWPLTYMNAKPPKVLQISHNNLQDLNPSFLGNLIFSWPILLKLNFWLLSKLCSISMNLQECLESFYFGSFLSKLCSRWISRNLSILVHFYPNCVLDEFRGIFLFWSILLSGAGVFYPGAGVKKNPAPGKKNPAPESKIERFLEIHRNWKQFGW